MTARDCSITFGIELNKDADARGMERRTQWYLFSQLST